MIPENIDAPLVLASMLFLVICLLTIGIMVHLKQIHYRRKLIKKIKTPHDEWLSPDGDGQALALSDRSANPFVNILSAIGVKFNPGKSADSADTKLKFLRAGLRGQNVSTVFWGIKFLLAVVLPLSFLFATFLFFQDLASKNMLMAAIFLSLLGLILPDFWLRVKTTGRRNRIIKGFPDALDLLVVCVEAGMGLDAAINRVGEELTLAHPELSNEMKLLNLEMRAGKSRSAALRNLAERANVDDVNSLVTMLLQTDRFGTSVAQALRVFSDGFRTARYQRAEEIAAKIGTKLIFPLVLFIFPSFFVVAVGPAVIQIYEVLIVKGI
jgi:tight adherence protein C